MENLNVNGSRQVNNDNNPTIQSTQDKNQPPASIWNGVIPEGAYWEAPDSYENWFEGKVTKYTLRDSQNRELAVIKDNGSDGKADSIVTYTYNEEENIATKTTDEDADGNADEIETWEFDDKYRPIRESVDKDADGNPDTVVTREYVEDNQIIETREYYINDELSHSTTVYKNRNGQLFGQVEDYNGDRVPDRAWGVDFKGNKLESPNNQAVSDEETEDNSGKDAFNSFFGI